MALTEQEIADFAARVERISSHAFEVGRYDAVRDVNGIGPEDSDTERLGRLCARFGCQRSGIAGVVSALTGRFVQAAGMLRPQSLCGLVVVPMNRQNGHDYPLDRPAIWYSDSMEDSGDGESIGRLLRVNGVGGNWLRGLTGCRAPSVEECEEILRVGLRVEPEYFEETYRRLCAVTATAAAPGPPASLAATLAARAVALTGRHMPPPPPCDLAALREAVAEAGDHDYGEEARDLAAALIGRDSLDDPAPPSGAPGMVLVCDADDARAFCINRVDIDADCWAIAADGRSRLIRSGTLLNYRPATLAEAETFFAACPLFANLAGGPA